MGKRSRRRKRQRQQVNKARKARVAHVRQEQAAPEPLNIAVPDLAQMGAIMQAAISGGPLTMNVNLDELDDDLAGFFPPPPWEDQPSQEGSVEYERMVSEVRQKAEARANRAKERRVSKNETTEGGNVIPLPPPINAANDKGKCKDYKEFPVVIKTDTKLEYPQLYCSVFLAAEEIERPALIEWLVRAGCYRARSPETADLVVFGGGVDVDPRLYGVTNIHPKTERTNEARDNADIELYLQCQAQGIPMVGICRGAQFLHVMNGGILFQDVDNHMGPHSILDLNSREVINSASSVHHQMCKFNPDGMDVLATANKSRKRYYTSTMYDEGPYADVEAFFYRDTMCIGFQGHPEYSDYHQFAVWALKKIEECIICNPDTDWVDGVRRINPDLIAIRNQGEILITLPSEGTVH